MWEVKRRVTPVNNMLMVYLTVTGRSVSLRHFYRSFFLQNLPENPTNHADSRNFKEIQGVRSTLDFLEMP